MHFSNKLIFLIPPFYSAERCDICSDGESDRDCIFDKSLSAVSGPVKEIEMGLQAKKESSWDFMKDPLLQYKKFLDT